MFLSDFFFFCQSTATVFILRYCLMNTAVIPGLCRGIIIKLPPVIPVHNGLRLYRSLLIRPQRHAVIRHRHRPRGTPQIRMLIQVQTDDGTNLVVQCMIRIGPLKDTPFTPHNILPVSQEPHIVPIITVNRVFGHLSPVVIGICTVRTGMIRRETVPKAVCLPVHLLCRQQEYLVISVISKTVFRLLQPRKAVLDRGLLLK